MHLHAYIYNFKEARYPGAQATVVHWQAETLQSKTVTDLIDRWMDSSLICYDVAVSSSKFPNMSHLTLNQDANGENKM